MVYSKNKVNSWIIIDHPHSIVTAISISKFLTENKFIKPNLIVSKHEYWKKTEISKHEKYFSDIAWFERIDIPPYSMPYWKQIAASLIMVFRLQRLNMQVSKLNIKKEDVIFGLSGWQILENMIISKFSKSWRIAVLPELVGIQEKQCKRLQRKQALRYSLGGLITRFVYCPLFGLYNNDYLITKGMGKKSDGDRYWIYTNGVKKVYDKVLYMVNITDKRGLEGGDTQNVRKIFYPHLLVMSQRTKPKRIVYFGMPFVSSWGISRKMYIRKINRYLSYIIKSNGTNYIYEYRPHPQEKDEFQKLKLRNFKVTKDKMIAETYLLGRKDVKSVFSVCSTSSRSALNIGINAYTFPTLFPIKLLNIESYKSVFGKAPNIFFLKSFKRKPKEIVLLKNKKRVTECINRKILWSLQREEI